MNKLHKAVITPISRARGYYPVRIREFDFKLDPYHINFWRNVGKMRWEPKTYEILDTYLKEDDTYVDIGSWIGPTVTYAAKKCKKVYCFEPDQSAFKYLRWNIELNNLYNVTAFNLAISDTTGIQRMGSFGELGDSMTSLLNKKELDTGGIDVLTQSWSDFLKVAPWGKIDFLKIDIEGGEFDLLPTLKPYLAEHKPIVYLSTHTPFLDEEGRKDNMQKIIDSMSMYEQCLNDDLAPVEFQTQNSKEIVDKFQSYLFLK